MANNRIINWKKVKAILREKMHSAGTLKEMQLYATKYGVAEKQDSKEYAEYLKEKNKVN